MALSLRHRRPDQNATEQKGQSNLSQAIPERKRIARQVPRRHVLKLRTFLYVSLFACSCFFLLFRYHQNQRNPAKPSVALSQSDNESPSMSSANGNICTPQLHEQFLHHLNNKDMASTSATRPPRQTIWVAAFPGSGSELFRTLIETLTTVGGKGAITDEVYSETSCQGAVTCKTHWPMTFDEYFEHPEERLSRNFSKRTILLVRHPGKAFPSWFNYGWEMRHGLESHSVQGPEADWRKWRDDTIDHCVERWRDTLQQWSLFHHQTGDIETYEVGLYVPYEDLTDPVRGPMLVRQVAALVQQETDVPVMPDHLVPCVWQHVVRDRPTRKRIGHAYQPCYRESQRQQISRALDQTMHVLVSEPMAVQILKRYYQEMSAQVCVEESESGYKITTDKYKEHAVEYVHEDGDDRTDKLDFSGGHDVDTAYRLGDVFVVWYLKWQTFDELLHDYATAYPNTLAHEYLLEVGKAEYAHRNLTALLRVMDRKEKKMHYRRAREDELLVHLRLGDVLTDEEYTDLSVPINQTWNQDEGFVNYDGNVKSNYNKAEFKELLGRIPPKAAKKIKKCVIVGAGFITVKENANRNVEYKELVAASLSEKLGCQVSHYSSSNPDKDLMFMASAYWFLAAMGGFAQIAAACVNARRGWGHALYDKFNGEIAGWDDNRFTEAQQRVFRNEYVDWSRVEYEVS